ncbi:MAG: DnaB-like helicase N-terminal domain-containing protein, partial [Bacillota bacterium]
MEEKVLPHSLDAEQNVLGAVFIDSNTIKMIVDQLDSDDFYSPRHKK